MMFAQSQFTPPGGIAGWLACLAFILWIVNLVWKLADRAKQRPAPSDVQRESVEKFVAKTEFANHVEWNRREHENLFAKIGGVERGLTQRIESRLDKMQADSHEGREKIHDRINEILAAVSNLEGRLEEKSR